MRTLTTTTPPPPTPPQCFLSGFRSTSRSSLLFTARPKRFLLLPPCSSVKGAKKQTAGLLKGTTTPQSLRRFLNPKGDGDDGKGDAGGGGSKGGTAVKGTLLAALLLVAVVGGFGSVGYFYKDQINAFLTQFSGFIEGYGPAGYALFVAVYAGLEILAIPAIPLTMSAGLLFGTLIGTIIVSLSGTLAAAVAFLIARYFARERILRLVEGNKKFLAIDKAIGENGFKLVGNASWDMGLCQCWCIRASTHSRRIRVWVICGQ